MLPTKQGSIRLFRLSGIEVFLHWSWFLIAAYSVATREGRYASLIWNGLEYVSLFGIVLMHEFGHAIACRQVGGQANQIVLWPLGGVAYVAPPQRPGAMLWSIAAGPLVNLMLAPVLLALVFVGNALNLPASAPDAAMFLKSICLINFVLLFFNLLPIFPLDGGQILRSLLWFAVGRARSLMITSIVGFAGVALFLLLALLMRSVWTGIIAVFILLNCFRGLLQARAMGRIANAPRRSNFACPACRSAPPQGAFWICGQCRRPFDTFETQASCPHCGAQFGVTACFECGALRPISDWWSAATAVPPRL